MSLSIDNSKKKCIHLNNYHYCHYGECKFRNKYDTKTNKCLINKLLYKVDIDLKEYNYFHQGLLNNLNYNNLIIAGGSLSKLYLNIDKNSSLYKGSDIDIYLYGTQKEKINKLKYLLKFFKYTILIPYNNVYTLYFRGKTRMIQIICGVFKNKYDIIKDFDYSHVQILYDGNKFLTTYKFLDNIHDNKTEYNYQYDINLFRIYKTLLLGLDIVNYKHPYQIDNKKYSKERFFQTILNTNSFKQDLDNIYYPSAFESLDSIKEKLYNIYSKKYIINKYSFYNIINNLNLINTIEWKNDFKQVIISSYGTQYDYTCMTSFINKLFTISTNNYYYELKEIKKLMKDDTTFFKKEFYYKIRMISLIKNIIKINNISFIYQILITFKNIISKFSTEEKIDLLTTSYETGNKDIIHLLKSYLNIDLIKNFSKTGKYYVSDIRRKIKLIYINILKSGNITLFEEQKTQFEKYLPQYLRTIPDINKYLVNKNDILIYSYQSNNLEFIKYIYKIFDYENYFSNIKNRICYNTFLGIINYINDFEVFKFLMENSSINYNYFEIRYAITNLIKDKKHKMVKYILNKYEFNNIDRIFGFLCYLGDIELVKQLLNNYGPDPGDYNYGAFRYACKSGNLELVKLLLKLEPNTDIEAYNNCAIKFACLEGHLNIIKYLLSIKPKINLFENTNTKYSICDCYNTNYNNATNIYKCDIFCYVLEGGHLNVISYFISLMPSKIKHFENRMYYKNKKIRFIQNKLKELLFNPRSKFGIERLEKEYQDLIE